MGVFSIVLLNCNSEVDSIGVVKTSLRSPRSRAGQVFMCLRDEEIVEVLKVLHIDQIC
jgi:hypothetical protein